MYKISVGYKKRCQSECQNSYVTIYDGVNLEHPDNNWILLTACGNRIPEAVISSRNGMMLKFVTDGNKDDHGFLAHFDFLLQHSENIECGGVYWGDSTIRSPDLGAFSFFMNLSRDY